MWLFKIDELGNCPLGNAGQMKTHYKRIANIHTCAAALAGSEHCKVYLLPDFTQKMCEMTPSQFAEHVQRYGKLILSQGDQRRGRIYYR